MIQYLVYNYNSKCVKMYCKNVQKYSTLKGLIEIQRTD